ncbi:MAG: hypothetical protein R3F17_15570 [Planctomycetota bacterium]
MGDGKIELDFFDENRSRRSKHLELDVFGGGFLLPEEQVSTEVRLSRLEMRGRLWRARGPCVVERDGIVRVPVECVPELELSVLDRSTRQHLRNVQLVTPWRFVLAQETRDRMRAPPEPESCDSPIRWAEAAFAWKKDRAELWIGAPGYAWEKSTLMLGRPETSSLEPGGTLEVHWDVPLREEGRLLIVQPDSPSEYRYERVLAEGSTETMVEGVRPGALRIYILGAVGIGQETQIPPRDVELVAGTVLRVDFAAPEEAPDIPWLGRLTVHPEWKAVPTVRLTPLGDTGSTSQNFQVRALGEPGVYALEGGLWSGYRLAVFPMEYGEDVEVGEAPPDLDVHVPAAVQVVFRPVPDLEDPSKVSMTLLSKTSDVIVHEKASRTYSSRTNLRGATSTPELGGFAFELLPGLYRVYFGTSARQRRSLDLRAPEGVVLVPTRTQASRT